MNYNNYIAILTLKRKMTLDEVSKAQQLLKKWLYSLHNDDFYIFLNFLETVDKEKNIYNQYNQLPLDEFYKIRAMMPNASKHLFFEFYTEFYFSAPLKFIEPEYEITYRPKKQTALEKLFDKDYSKLNPHHYGNDKYFDVIKGAIKAYKAVTQFGVVAGKYILKQNNYAHDFANNQQLEKAFSNERGFYIGGGYHFNDDGHLLTVGGSGAGKGVNFIIPALLSPALVASGSSVVVLDPKGENLAICGEHLKRNGYKVLVINPFNISEISGFGKTGFNPFSLTSKNDIEAPKFCDLIAECLIPDAGANSAHWTDSARQYISLYLLYMVATDQANFQNLFEAVRLGGADRIRYLENMRKCLAFGGVISATAGGIAEQLLQGGGSQEIESIYSTIRRGTDIFKDLQLRQHVKKSDFDLTKLAHEKTALFVCVNPAELQLFSGWLRVFFGCVFRSLQKNYNPNKRVLMVLDEFPQIGRLREFEMAVAYMRGYNVTIWAIIQDLSQLKKLYWDSWESFVGSAAVKMWLPLGADNFTIDYLENRLPLIDKPNIEHVRSEFSWKVNEGVKQKILSKFDLITCQDALIEGRGLGNFARFEKKPYWLLDWAKNASPNPFRKTS